jgi:hypothetical protein
VLVFSDERLPTRLGGTDGAAWIDLLPPGTVVHVIRLRDTAGSLVRDDSVQLSALAKATGGIGVDGTRPPDDEPSLLVRPRSLDNVSVQGAGWTDAGAACTGSNLPEGTSCTWLGVSTPGAGPIKIEGWLWNQRVERIVTPDPTHALDLARELAAAGSLDAALQAQVDRAAMAVDSVWSLFATWGGRGGYADRYGVGRLSGTGGSTDSSTIVDSIDIANKLPEIDLAEQLAGPIAAACPGAHGSVDLELTREEIVDVRVTPASSCAEDAIWDTIVVVPDAPENARASFRY